MLKKKFHSMWTWVVDHIGDIPFIGHALTKCGPRDYWTSSIEYLNTIVWSTMPFWLGTGLIYVQASNTGSLGTVFQSTFQNGELFVYAISTLTPITYLTLFEDPKGRFPHRLGIGTLAFIMIIGCAGLFALQKGHVATKAEVLYYGSIYFAIAAITLRYFAVLYNKTKLTIPGEQDFTSSTGALISNFEAEADKLDENSQSTNPPQANNSKFDDALAAADTPRQSTPLQGGR